MTRSQMRGTRHPRHSSACAGIVLAIGASGSAAVAADLGPAPPLAPSPPAIADSGWQFTIAPYGWFTSVKGSTTVRGLKSNVDESFPDIVQKSDSVLGLMGHVEARHDNWSIYGDAVWSRLDFSHEKFRQASPVPGLVLATALSASVTYTSFIGEAGITYQLVRWAWPNSASTTAIDVLGGLRYWNQSLDLSVTVAGAANLVPLGFQVAGLRAVGKSGTLDWVDPLGGFRIRHTIAPGDELQLRADIGGFGVGSKFSWQVFGGYGHDFNMWGTPVQGFIGYRALSVDYSKGVGFQKNGLNMVLHGPVIGAAFKF
jgi:hypothetical protein